MKTYICGMPVRVQYLDRADQTQVHLLRPVTEFQRDLVRGWLEHQGNVVIPGRWSYIAVEGELADTRPRSIHS